MITKQAWEKKSTRSRSLRVAINNITEFGASKEKDSKITMNSLSDENMNGSYALVRMWVM